MRRACQFYLLVLLAVIISSCTHGGRNDDPETVRTFSTGQSLYLKKDFSAACVQFQEVVRKNPAHIPAQIMLGKARYYAGDPSRSAQVFAGILKKKPESITALVWLARIEGIEMDQREKGLAYCKRVLDLDPENYLANFYKGIMMEESGKVKEAIFAYSAAIDLENIVYLAHYKLGRLYQEKGLFDKALLEYREVLKYDLGKDLETDVRKRIKSNENRK